MRSSLYIVVRASDCQCTLHKLQRSWVRSQLRRHSGIWGAADEAVLNIVRTKRKKSPKKIFEKKMFGFYTCHLSTLYYHCIAGACLPIHMNGELYGTRGLQRDVVHLGWPIAPSYMSPNSGGGVLLLGLSQVQPYTGAQINFGDLTPYLTFGGTQK